jgi:hypothetical protein
VAEENKRFEKIVTRVGLFLRRFGMVLPGLLSYGMALGFLFRPLFLPFRSTRSFELSRLYATLRLNALAMGPGLGIFCIINKRE